MIRKKWPVYLFWVALSLGVGALSAFFSKEGMDLYEATAVKPPLSPPGVLFPIVWSILYVLMGVGAARIYLTEPGPLRSKALNLFAAQLIVNFFWSLIFFNLQVFDFALLWLLLLWGLVAWMILTFSKLDKWAALLQLPYLLWLTFAAWLNAGVWLLNP